MLKDRYAFELAISELGEKEKLSLDIKRTITRVEEFLRTADGSSYRGTAEEGNFWSMVLGPITSAISCFRRLYCSGDPEADLTQGEQELSLRNIEMELKLGEFCASSSQKRHQYELTCQIHLRKAIPPLDAKFSRSDPANSLSVCPDWKRPDSPEYHDYGPTVLNIAENLFNALNAMQALDPNRRIQNSS